MKKVKRPQPTKLELEAQRRRDAAERASCGIGIDDDEPRSVRLSRMKPDRGGIWRRVGGNPYSRNR
jgi:hypothetical protein